MSLLPFLHHILPLSFLRTVEKEDPTWWNQIHENDDHYRVLLLKVFGVLPVDAEVTEQAFYCFGGDFDVLLQTLEAQLALVLSYTIGTPCLLFVYKAAAMLNLSLREDIGQGLLCTVDYLQAYIHILVAAADNDLVTMELLCETLLARLSHRKPTH
jgi:hypothetical protein